MTNINLYRDACVVSTGMLRVRIDHDRYALRIASYEDRLEFKLVPVGLRDGLKSPQQLYMSRGLLRGIFPDESLSTVRTDVSHIRSINITFIYDRADDSYVCVLPRTLETYKQCRNWQSKIKDGLSL